MFLVPTRIVNYVKIKDYAVAQQWGLSDCMECGTCAYACPAAIPLVQWLRLGKSEVMHLNKTEAEK
jgi:electron transport complex protein RnfC